MRPIFARFIALLLVPAMLQEPVAAYVRYGDSAFGHRQGSLFKTPTSSYPDFRSPNPDMFASQALAPREVNSFHTPLSPLEDQAAEIAEAVKHGAAFTRVLPAMTPDPARKAELERIHHLFSSDRISAKAQLEHLLFDIVPKEEMIYFEPVINATLNELNQESENARVLTPRVIHEIIQTVRTRTFFAREDGFEAFEIAHPVVLRYDPNAKPHPTWTWVDDPSARRDLGEAYVQWVHKALDALEEALLAVEAPLSEEVVRLILSLTIQRLHEEHNRNALAHRDRPMAMRSSRASPQTIRERRRRLRYVESTPAGELLGALGLQDFESLSGEEIPIPAAGAFPPDVRIKRIHVEPAPASAGLAQGLAILPQELGPTSTFDLLLNQYGQIIAIFPVSRGDSRASFHFFNISPFNVRVRPIGTKGAEDEWDIFVKQFIIDLQAIEAYQNYRVPSNIDLKPVDEVRQAPYVYAEVNRKSGKLTVTLGIRPDQVNPYRAHPKKRGFAQAIIPVFETVIIRDTRVTSKPMPITTRVFTWELRAEELNRTGSGFAEEIACLI